MKVATPLEDYEIKPDDICCFLAGGISGCPDWQDKVITTLKAYDDWHCTDNLIIFNPRRDVWDPEHDSAVKQIEWEFKYLNQVDIFSMYFCKDSIQPICLYELGRYIEVMKKRFPDDYNMRIIISIEEGYERTLDVEEQVRLACPKRPLIWNRLSSIELHAEGIAHTAGFLEYLKSVD